MPNLMLTNESCSVGDDVVNLDTGTPGTIIDAHGDETIYITVLESDGSTYDHTMHNHCSTTELEDIDPALPRHKT